MHRIRNKNGTGFRLPWLAVAAALALAIAGGLYINGPEASPSAYRSPTWSDSGVVSKEIFTGAHQALAQMELLAELTLLTGSAEGIYGIAVVELDTGESFGLNQDIAFPAASTTKLAVLGKLFQELESGSIAKSDTMIYRAEDYEEGTGSIQYGEPGTTWTVAELAQKMIAESDNVAKNMLMRLLGRDAVAAFAFAQGAAFDFYNNETTPRSMAVLLESLYRQEIAGPEPTREMLDLMTDTLYETRLPRYLTRAPVAHKIGTWGDAVSDVGIVLSPDKPFVICVYSEATGSLEEAEELIGRIAAAVFAYEAGRVQSGGARI